ncbi:MAG: HAD-IC family P-type ATPase [Acidobacteria bacterium]|nr:HAD-IC family P-type ATPase [Acidobacteriota bacterium]
MNHHPISLPEHPHALSLEHVLAALRTTPAGLTRDEAALRFERFGPNALPHAKPPSILIVFLHQFLNPLIYVLLFAVVVSLALGDLSDAGFIVVVLLINAVIGTAQEHSAARSAEALQQMVVSQARVIRDSEDCEVGAEELVPGDVVLVESGMKIPADLRLLTSSGLQVDESLLTGESLPTTKRPDATLPLDTTLGDRSNMVFAGTLVARGRATGVVVATGILTQLGRIATSVVGTVALKPPLLIRMELFTRRIAAVMGIVVVLLGSASLARGASIREVFFTAVALAVSAIPEGLPVALTVALAIGARRMSRRNVIARRLVAVEALGSCTFIASDKTGTLTLNELTTRIVLTADGRQCSVTGEGTVPDGEVLIPAETDQPAAHALLDRIAVAVVLCNDGFLGKKDGGWVSHGDAVDVALLVLAHKLGITQAALEPACPRLAEIPFEPERRFAATLNCCARGPEAFVKGASERVLPICTRMATQDGDIPIDIAELESQANHLASQGYRVLAVAAGPVVTDSPDDFNSDHLTGLVFLGFTGMIDPLRPEAQAAVDACQRAGIAVAMVTGDHPITALAIARELGFAESPEQVVSGPQLRAAEEHGEAAIDNLIQSARVFARMEPDQKLAIVRSLIRLGHFVAVTGDGANDAPALRAAHIGVAMGRRGTDIARETADLILADDNFSSIAAGVEEGRIAYGNVRKVIFLLISTGAAELILFFLAIVSGLPLPLLPVQLLWLNVVTNGIQDVALAFEPGEGGELRRQPRPPREPIFNHLLIRRTLVSALVMGGLSFAAYVWMLNQGWELAQVRNGILLLMVLFENIQAGNSRSEIRSLFQLSPWRNPFLFLGTLLAQLLHIAALYTPGLSDVLQVQPVSFLEWALCFVLALPLLGALEADKALSRRGVIPGIS